MHKKTYNGCTCRFSNWMPITTHCEILKKMISGGRKVRGVGTQPELKHCCELPNWPFVYWLARNYEPRFAQCWAHILSLSKKEIRYGPFTSVFLLFILVYKNLLFLYRYGRVCFGIGSRKVLWGRFPIIGQSGLVNDHSLSRRHKQYIMLFRIWREFPSWIIESSIHNNFLLLSFWLSVHEYL